MHIKEARALLSSVKNKLVNPSSWHARHVVIGDNLGVILAASKGRCASVPLLLLLRKIAGVLLASGSLLVPRWTPSELNPADAPSRLSEEGRDVGSFSTLPRRPKGGTFVATATWSRPPGPERVLARPPPEDKARETTIATVECGPPATAEAVCRRSRSCKGRAGGACSPQWCLQAEKGAAADRSQPSPRAH